MISSCTRATSYNTRSMPHWLPSQAAMDRSSNLCGRRSRWFGVGLPSRRRAQCHCRSLAGLRLGIALVDGSTLQRAAGREIARRGSAGLRTDPHSYVSHLPQALFLGRISALTRVLEETCELHPPRHARQHRSYTQAGLKPEDEPLPGTLLLFGFGYTAERFCRRQQTAGWQVQVVVRSEETRQRVGALGASAIDLNNAHSAAAEAKCHPRRGPPAEGYCPGLQALAPRCRSAATPICVG